MHARASLTILAAALCTAALAADPLLGALVLQAIDK